MTPQSLRLILLAQAIEQNDPQGQLLSADDRRASLAAARQLYGEAPANAKVRSRWVEQVLSRRAEILVRQAVAARPSIQALADAPLPSLATAMLLSALAGLLLGFFANRLVAADEINLLALPVYAIVAWNGVAMLAWGARAVMASARRRSIAASLAARILAALGSLIGSLMGSLMARRHPGAGGIARSLHQSWTARMLPVRLAQSAAALHLGAAMLAVGAIVGTAWQVWPNEYPVIWRGFWVHDAAAVQRLLDAFFGPILPIAEWLGVRAFSIDELLAMHRQADVQIEHQHRWFWLQALALAGYVVIPRLVLMAIASIAAGRRRTVALSISDDPGFALQSAEAFAEPRVVRVWPYSIDASTIDRRALQKMLEASLGPIDQIDLMPATAYGDLPPTPVIAAAAGARSKASPIDVALFNFASTPEAETHRAFLDALKTRSGTAGLWLAVDARAFRERLGTIAEGERGRAREGLWRRLADAAGASWVRLDDDR